MLIFLHCGTRVHSQGQGSPDGSVRQVHLGVVFGSLVKIEFLAFHLEEDGTDWDYDYVIFYDGDSKNSDILAGPFCGPIISFIPEIYSSTEYLTMEFVSDESTAEGGFQATYEQMDGTPCGESIIKPTGK